MIKRKPQLHEEIQKMDYLLGYDKDFSYDEAKSYNEKKHIKESKQLLKTTNTRDLEKLNEWAQAARFILPKLANVGRFGARIGNKLPGKGKVAGFLKSLAGVGNVGTKGLEKATGLGSKQIANIAKGAGYDGSRFLTNSAYKSILKKEALSGIGSLIAWGFGLNMLANWGSEGESAVEAAGAMENWGTGEGDDATNKMALAFSPVFYKETYEGTLRNSVDVTFMDKGTITKLADVIHDATEGGEKYTGKGVVDWAVGGLADFVGAGDYVRGAGTDEEEVNRAIRACTTIADISHLSGVYETKYGVPLIEELVDELDEGELLDIQQIVQDKPLAIIDGKRIFNPEDLNDTLEGISKDLIQKPEGLPKFRTRFNSLFDGKMVDVWVKRTGDIAIVFIGDKFVGEFQYIRSSGKVYFKPVGEEPMSITDKEDENQVMKIFGAADDEEQAASDLGTLSRSINVGGRQYSAGTPLSSIEGPNGTAAEYIDELKEDNPTIATTKPTVIQGAAIAVAMGEENYQIIQETITDLRSVLGESRLLEQDYSVSFDRGDDKYKIRRINTGTTNPNNNTTPTYKPAMSLQDVASGAGSIRKGEKGDAIVTIQTFLNVPNVTGVYDDETFDRVVSFQSQNNIVPANGLVGPETALAIIRAINVKQPTPKTNTNTQTPKTNNNTQTTPDKKETEKKINRVAGRYASEDEAQDVLDQVRNLEDTEVSYDTCVEVIATASRALPAKGGPSTYKVLQFCYDKYNFGRLGKTSRKVKREYGISHDGDRRNRRRR